MTTTPTTPPTQAKTPGFTFNPRQVVAISCGNTYVYVSCIDGTVWYKAVATPGAAWVQETGLPASS